MIHERSDCAFGGVAAMDVGRGEPEADGFAVHKLLERGGGFVVELLEAGAEATGGE